MLQPTWEEYALNKGPNAAKHSSQISGSCFEGQEKSFKDTAVLLHMAGRSCQPLISHLREVKTASLALQTLSRTDIRLPVKSSSSSADTNNCLLERNKAQMSRVRLRWQAFHFALDSVYVPNHIVYTVCTRRWETIWVEDDEIQMVRLHLIENNRENDR